MRLTDLLAGASGPLPAMPQGIEILGLTADSRAVGPGFLFAALPGAKADGRQFIDDAVARGAVAILAPESARQDGLVTPVPVIYDVDPRRRLALMAAHFYRAQPRHVAAVTGTNGKTSVAWFTRQIWEAFGHRAASMGTLGLRAEGFEAGPSLTTPDPVALHRDLARLAASGIDRLAIEASSHGLVQCRLDGVVIAAAAFTNLTRDHLDYHGTMEAYRAAKLRLFDTLLPRGAAAVLNADSPEYGLFAETARNRGSPVIAYGAAGIELRIDASRPTATGQEIAATVFGRRHHVSLPLPGAFQAANAFCALGLAVATGEDPDAAVARLAELAPVPGRLQLAARKANGAAIYVDYAHTPDALETVIAALRPHAAGRLVVVFGCGGDRDPGKRPMMGAIAARLADRAIVTNDNPRSEDPASIRRAILAAAPGAAEIGDRGRAIRTAADALGPGDILLIAGKGHETGQIVGTEVRPFDDVIAAREAVGGGGAS